MTDYELEQITQKIAKDRINTMIPNLTDHGQCTGCGKCCMNFLPLTTNDMSRIQKYIKKHGVQPINRINPTIPARQIDAMCPFLDESRLDGKKCTIYNVRPFICRHYICSINTDENAAQIWARNMIQDKDITGYIIAHIVNMRSVFFPDSPDTNMTPDKHIPVSVAQTIGLCHNPEP